MEWKSNEKGPIQTLIIIDEKCVDFEELALHVDFEELALHPQ